MTDNPTVDLDGYYVLLADVEEEKAPKNETAPPENDDGPEVTKKSRKDATTERCIPCLKLVVGLLLVVYVAIFFYLGDILVELSPRGRYYYGGTRQGFVHDTFRLVSKGTQRIQSWLSDEKELPPAQRLKESPMDGNDEVVLGRGEQWTEPPIKIELDKKAIIKDFISERSHHAYEEAVKEWSNKLISATPQDASHSETTTNVVDDLEEWNEPTRSRRVVYYGNTATDTLLRALDSRTFPGAIQESDRPYLIFYSVPWCSHCVCARRVFQELAEIGFNLAEVNCMENAALCRQQSVFSFPTIRLYGNNLILASYDQPVVTVEALKKFIEQALKEQDEVGRHYRKAHDETVPQLTPYNFTPVLDMHGSAFVVFQPEACLYRCHDLGAAWKMEDNRNLREGLHGARIFRVICLDYPDLCRDAGVSAHDEHPDIRWYQRGDLIVPRYTRSLLTSSTPLTGVFNANNDKVEVKRRDESMPSDDLYETGDDWNAADDDLNDVDDYYEEEEEEEEGGGGYYDKEVEETKAVEMFPGDVAAIMKDVIFLKGDTFDAFLREHQHVFVFFFAPWCVWCRRAMPVWNTVAQELANDPVEIVAVDCVAEADICRRDKARILAYPTFRWYERGDAKESDYKMDRAVRALTAYAKRMLGLDDGLHYQGFDLH